MSRSDPAFNTLVESRIDSQIVYRGNFLELRRDRVLLPDGSESSREFIVHPGAAVMVPLFEDGRVLIERQFRYPVGQVFAEVPAGKRDPGESFIATAQRELLEETGYEAAEWAYLTRLHPAIGFADEVLEIYLCRGLKFVGRRLDDGEFLETETVTVDWMLEAVRAGQLTDVKTQIVAFWLDRLRSGGWPWPEFVSVR